MYFFFLQNLIKEYNWVARKLLLKAVKSEQETKIVPHMNASLLTRLEPCYSRAMVEEAQMKQT